MAKYSEARIEEIRDHQAKLTRRGISVADYADEIGVSAWTVYAWRNRFEPGRPRADLIEIERAPPTSAIEIVAGTLTVRTSRLRWCWVTWIATATWIWPSGVGDGYGSTSTTAPAASPTRPPR